MNSLLSSHNHLFELARRGRWLPHGVLAVVLTFLFILLAQLTGGTVGGIIVFGLSLIQTGATAFTLDDPAALSALVLPDTAIEQAILLIFAFGPIFLIVWAWLALFEKRPFWTLGLERAGAGLKYLRGVGVGLLMFVAAIGISAAFGFISPASSSSQPQGMVALGGVLLVLLGWIVQGAAEEALTRGWLLPVVGARHNPVLGVIISSAVFSLFHSLNFFGLEISSGYIALALFNLFLFGVFTALYALYERSLWGVFSLHSIWNWAQGNLFGFQVSGQNAPGGTLFDLMEVGPDAVTGGAFGPEGGLSVTIVLLVSCAIVWGLARRRAGEMSSQKNS